MLARYVGKVQGRLARQTGTVALQHCVDRIRLTTLRLLFKVPTGS